MPGDTLPPAGRSLMERCRPRTAGAVLSLLALVWGGLASAAIQLPVGPNRSLIYGKCRTCHDLQYLKESAGITRAQWQDVLVSMETYGLEVSQQQRQEILAYLTNYLGPNPPPKAAAAKPAEETKVSGETLFTRECIACHQTNGQGQAGEFPPLAGNPDLFRTRVFPVLVLLNGLHGKIQVKGNTYNGQMPSFDVLSNADIAKLVNYVRGAWGNGENRPAGMKPITAEDVAGARKKSLTPAQVHAYRARHE
jgi:mono/diheme cytochrome c family protein